MGLVLCPFARQGGAQSGGDDHQSLSTESNLLLLRLSLLFISMLSMVLSLLSRLFSHSWKLDPKADDVALLNIGGTTTFPGRGTRSILTVFGYSDSWVLRLALYMLSPTWYPSLTALRILIPMVWRACWLLYCSADASLML